MTLGGRFDYKRGLRNIRAFVRLKRSLGAPIKAQEFQPWRLKCLIRLMKYPRISSLLRKSSPILKVVEHFRNVAIQKALLLLITQPCQSQLLTRMALFLSSKTYADAGQKQAELSKNSSVDNGSDDGRKGCEAATAYLPKLLKVSFAQDRSSWFLVMLLQILLVTIIFFTAKPYDFREAQFSGGMRPKVLYHALPIIHEDIYQETDSSYVSRLNVVLRDRSLYTRCNTCHAVSIPYSVSYTANALKWLAKYNLHNEFATVKLNRYLLEYYYGSATPLHYFHRFGFFLGEPLFFVIVGLILPIIYIFYIFLIQTIGYVFIEPFAYGTAESYVPRYINLSLFYFRYFKKPTNGNAVPSSHRFDEVIARATFRMKLLELNLLAKQSRSPYETHKKQLFFSKVIMSVYFPVIALLGTLIWTALICTYVQAIASPFSALGQLFAMAAVVWVLYSILYYHCVRYKYECFFQDEGLDMFHITSFLEPFVPVRRKDVLANLDQLRKNNILAQFFYGSKSYLEIVVAVIFIALMNLFKLIF